MQAPIPEVPEHREHIEKTRPAGLKAVTLLMCAFNMTAFLLIGSDNELPLYIDIPLMLVIIGVSFLVLWFFWKGYNWARILVLLTSIVALVNIFFMDDMSNVQRIITIAEMLLGAYLLYWLNTKPIKEYFKQPILS